LVFILQLLECKFFLSHITDDVEDSSTFVYIAELLCYTRSPCFALQLSYDFLTPFANIHLSLIFAPSCSV